MVLDEKVFTSRGTGPGRLYEQRRRVRGGYKNSKKGTTLTRPGTKNAPGRGKKVKTNACAGFVGCKMVLWTKVQGNLSAKKFCYPHLVRALKVAKAKKLTMDSATPHSANFTKRFLKKHKISTTSWPPSSPDLMPLGYT